MVDIVIPSDKSFRGYEIVEDDELSSLGAPLWMELDLDNVIDWMSSEYNLKQKGVNYTVPRFGVYSTLLEKTPVFIYGDPRLVQRWGNTAFTDGMHIFICADFYKQIVEDEDSSNGKEKGVVPLVLHELGHILDEDCYRLRQYDPILANIAQDYIRNTTLRLEFPSLIFAKSLTENAVGFAPGDLEKYPYLSQEVIAEDLYIKGKKKEEENKKEEQKIKVNGQRSDQEQDETDESESQEIDVEDEMEDSSEDDDESKSENKGSKSKKSKSKSGGKSKNTDYDDQDGPENDEEQDDSQSHKNKSDSNKGSKRQSNKNDASDESDESDEGENEDDSEQDNDKSNSKSKNKPSENDGMNDSDNTEEDGNPDENSEYDDDFDSDPEEDDDSNSEFEPDEEDDSDEEEERENGESQSGESAHKGGSPEPGNGGGSPLGAPVDENGNIKFGAKGDVHHHSLKDVIKALEECGLDRVLEKLNLPHSDDEKAIEEKENEGIDIKNQSIFETDVKRQELSMPSFPGEHSLDCAMERIKSVQKGKLSWKLKIINEIWGTGFNFKYNNDVVGDIYYVDELIDVIGMNLYMGQILPFKSQDVVAIIIDTSGSVGQKDLEDIVPEIIEMKLAAKGSSGAYEVVVFSADTVLRGEPVEINEDNVHEVLSGGLQIYGRGGTSLESAIQQTVKSQVFKDKKIKSLIYFTDLGDRAPRYERLGLDPDTSITFIAVPSINDFTVEAFAKEVEHYADVIKIKEGVEVDLSITPRIKQEANMFSS